MFKRIVLLAAVLVLILSLSLPSVAAEDTSGTIGGHLVNGTAGGSSVADVVVQLKTLVNFQETGTPVTAKTRSDGQFTFSNLPTSPNNSYAVTLTYQDAEYFSDFIAFGQGETSRSANITVYDSTNSDAALRVTTAHTIINVGKDSLDIIVIYDIVNASDRAYIGSGEIMSTGRRKTLTFSIPAEATQIKLGDGMVEKFILPSHEGFIDTMEVLPEGREVVYTYKLPYSGGTYKFQQKLDYPVAQFGLLVQGEDIKITSGQLTDQGPLDMGTGTPYLYLMGQNLARGEIVSATLSKPISQKMVVIWVAGALVLMIVGGGLAYWKFRGKSKVQPVKVGNKPATRAAEGIDQREQKLLTELARLDDDFTAGSIQEDAYRAQRAAKKAQLVKLLNTSREAGNSQ
ncbi:MAG: carboxypeptidase-like regulatory domain-containing protein [Dehalococcoidales bacterium]|nr:carboxypeptidase-like regulatory domain-containing protein [Dehalococcoidales bacterium]